MGRGKMEMGGKKETKMDGPVVEISGKGKRKNRYRGRKELIDGPKKRKEGKRET